MRVINQTDFFVRRLGANNSTILSALTISFLEIFEAPMRRSWKMIDTSPTFQPRRSTLKSISNKKE